MGLTNVKIMIPFVRTQAEAEGVIALLGEHGLVRGENGLEVVMMCEVPSNAILADAFLEHFDGFSIGSNDMTQLTLGLDRDSSRSEEHTSELQSLMRISYAVFCLKKTNTPDLYKLYRHDMKNRQCYTYPDTRYRC